MTRLEWMKMKNEQNSGGGSRVFLATGSSALDFVGRKPEKKPLKWHT